MASKLRIDSTVKLASGYHMPVLGFGTGGIRSPDRPLDIATDVCTQALKIGYRQIDSASAYKNQAESAASIKASGVPREDVFFTTKVPMKGTPMGYDGVSQLVDKALGSTGLGYLDLVLIHWPYGGTEARNGAWRALVDAVGAGKVRSIGVSNYGVHHLDELEAYIKQLEGERGGAKGSGGVISVGQWEFHPWLTRPDIAAWCRQRGVAMQAFCPLVRGERFGKEPKLAALAQRHGKTEAQVLLRWSLKKGFVPLVKSVTPSRIEENAGVFDFELTDEEVEDLTTDEEKPCAWNPSVEPLEK